MEIDCLVNYIGKRDVVVYGAGILGQALTEILYKYGIVVRAYVVSDGQAIKSNNINGIPVLTLSVWAKEHNRNDVRLLVAMSDYYKGDVEKLLNEYGIVDYLWTDKIHFQALIRDLKPVISNEMLVRKEPVSRAYGRERGKPIDRYYIERFLNENANRIQYAKSILEVGDNTYSKKYFPDATKWDILDYRKGMDLTKHATLPESCYDVFICTQTFNFIYDVKAAIRGSYYLLKKGGIMLATVMGPIGQVSSNDMKRWGDYWRFTDLGIKKLMCEVFGEEVKTYSYGNAPIATAWVQGMCLEDLPDKNLLDIVDDKYTMNICIFAKKSSLRK